MSANDNDIDLTTRVADFWNSSECNVAKRLEGSCVGGLPLLPCRDMCIAQEYGYTAQFCDQDNRSWLSRIEITQRNAAARLSIRYRYFQIFRSRGQIAFVKYGCLVDSGVKCPQRRLRVSKHLPQTGMFDIHKRALSIYNAAKAKNCDP